MRLSLLRPTSRHTRDFIGSTKGQIGLSYVFAAPGRSRIWPRLDLDYGRFSRSTTYSDGKLYLNHLALTLNALVPLSKRGNLRRGPYAGLGLGIARTSRRAPPPEEGAGHGPIVLAYPLSAARIGLVAKALIGYNFSSNLFGEIGYTQLPRAADVNPSNLFVEAGARF